MPKPQKIRRLWLKGELTGAEAAMDAGAAVSDIYWNANHYDVGGDTVCLSPITHDGRRVRDIFHAIHEAMHARQWHERSLEARMHALGGKTRPVWLLSAALAGIASLVRNWPCFFGAIGVTALVSLFKYVSILALEHDAWERAKAWMRENYDLTHEDYAEMDEIAKSGLMSYVKLDRQC